MTMIMFRSKLLSHQSAPSLFSRLRLSHAHGLHQCIQPHPPNHPPRLAYHHQRVIQANWSPFRSLRPLAFSRSATTASLLGLGFSIVGYQLAHHPIRLEGELLGHYRDSLQPEYSSPPSSVEATASSDVQKIESILSIQKLSFGTLTGICVGIFVRKGLTLLAFLFGGGFVILQYLHSKSLIKINWRTWSDRYDSKIRSIETDQGTQLKRKSIVTRFLEFLTSDFQYRSTFLVGFCLGLRIA